MTQPTPGPTPADARTRALRTLLQNLVIDVLLGIILVVMPVVQGTGSVDWRLLLASLLKTLFATLLSYGQRFLEAKKAGTV
ncbi:hypothetical protein [Actinocrispum wychmicini]|uniref:RDD family protein n=1 Tax=Actinocrispum wychmicini TaxID=1213861 RepID=A0A4R2JPM3_9PSEU|nr:hypothetical protein [Actinocrispum wychmicini]TCO58709.1 hypothetical protein EV192_105781 [Actinocrispum wychmicini]